MMSVIMMSVIMMSVVGPTEGLKAKFIIGVKRQNPLTLYSSSFYRTVKPFAKNSLPNGIQFLIDVEAFDYSVSTTGSEGLILSILHQLVSMLHNIFCH
jgi:hypothetical protein